MPRHESTMLALGWTDRIDSPDLVSLAALGRSPIKVTRVAKEAAEALFSVLEAEGYRNPSGYIGSYLKRTISGLDVWSTHAYGTAVDVDYGSDVLPGPFNPHLHRPIEAYDWDNIRITREQVLAVEAILTGNGKTVWVWKGWSIGDTMHFQIACTPDDLLTGIVINEEEDMVTIDDFVKYVRDQELDRAAALGLIFQSEATYFKGLPRTKTFGLNANEFHEDWVHLYNAFRVRLPFYA